MTDLNPSSGAQAPHTPPVSFRSKTGNIPACLSSEDIATLSKQREARWKPGLSDQPLHSEIFADACNASGAGAALALAGDFLRSVWTEKDALAEKDDRRQILWVQERRAIQRGGRPYLHGLPSEWRDRLIHVEAESAQDVLFALEEGLKCRDLACIIGEIVGNPRELDFTASRRLSLTAEKHGVPLWLVRLEAEADLSSARMRWRVQSASSQHPCWNDAAPGNPRWTAELFRARGHAPGEWTFAYDYKTLSIHKPDAQRTAQGVFQGGLGKALARQHRSSRRYSATSDAADTGHLVRATVGRSMAASARM
ncbi:MAG: recA-like protein [Pseudomonadota bacterium]